MFDAVILGAGPAGLSAAETLSRSDRQVTVLEATDHTGRISTTDKHRDFYFDLGGHRFFTKNKEIDRYVANLLGNQLSLVDRSSTLLLHGKFFDYPLKPLNAIFGLGPVIASSIISNYIIERLKWNRRPSRSLEDWLISQFGKTLYQLFFKTYTEKVWGMPCSQIQATWAAKRINGLSLWTAAANALFGAGNAKTLIDEFHCPELGSGMMWQRFQQVIARRSTRC